MIIIPQKQSKIKEFVIFSILFIAAITVASAGRFQIKQLIGNKSIEHAILDATIGYTSPSEKFAIEANQYQKEIESLKLECDNLKASTVSRGDVQRIVEVESEKLNKEKVIKAIGNNIKGVFGGKASFIYSTSKKHNVNPMLVTAIARHETGNGSSYAVVNLNNPGGLMGSRGLLRYDSLEYGIEAMIKNLKSLYIDMGLVTIEQIQKKYCPVGAKNDPTGINVHWLPMVTRSYIKILEESKGV